MSHEKKSNFLTKISPLIEGQLPDFVQEDHPLFVDFLKDYYQFLEAGKLEVNVTTDYIQLEIITDSYVLLEGWDEERLIDESFTGKFTNGETITGATSGATATILVEDSRNSVLYVSSQQKFITDESITGGTSGSSATISKYRANPVQNIQQLLEYADVDNTIYDFLDQLRNSFMESIPSTLATNTSKRNLLKNIKDLYSAKGTSEGHKLFMRLLLGEDANIIYPTEYMMRPSDGNWREHQIIRASAFSGVRGEEVAGGKITGQTSGATANVRAATAVLQGSTSVTEFQIENVVGTFVTGEVIKGRSTSRDVDVSFTMEAMFASGTVTNDGILHDVGEAITVEALGNGFGEAVVDVIKSGGVSGVVVDDAGSGYQVGDILTFTNPAADSDTMTATERRRRSVATGFVSAIGGGIVQETGTLDDSNVTTDTIILETDSNFTEEPLDIILETKGVDFFVGNGVTRVFSLNNTATLTDTLTLYLDDVKTDQTARNGDSIWSIEDTPYLVLSGTDGDAADAGDNILLEIDDAPQTGSVITLEQQEITFTKSPIDYTPANNVQIRVRGDDVNYILLDGTDGSSFTNAGSRLLTNQTNITLDKFKTSTDQISLEPDTFSTLGEIQKVIVTNSGSGYTDLPTVSVTSANGSGATLLAITDDIGAIGSIKIKEPGLNYSVTNPPDLTPRAHFVVKNVTGTFASGNTLTTHEGTVKGWDSSTQVLDATFENVIRIVGEESGTFNQGIQLEHGNTTGSLNTLLLEDVHKHDSDRKLLINSTGSTTRGPRYIRKKVSVVENTLNTIANSTTDAALGEKIFAIGGAYETSDFTAPRLEFFRGDTYYFDLSDISLYNADSTKNHQMSLAVLADRFEGDGSTTAFTLGNPVEATPIAFITTDSSSFENNIRTHANANNTSYTVSGNILTFTSAPGSGTHIIVFTKYTTGVTTSISEIAVGSGDAAYIQIETTTETPNLYYYCVNHGPRMGYAVSTKTVKTALYDVGSTLLINAESIGSKPQGILLEDGSQGVPAGTGLGVLTQEISDITEYIRFGLGTDDYHIENIILETGTESFGVTKADGTVRNAFLLMEELIAIQTFNASGNTISLEDAFIDLQHVGVDVLLESFESSSGDQILLDGTDSISQDAGARILAEDSVVQESRILLNGTDSDSSNVGDQLIAEDETGFDEITLNGSDSSTTDVNDNLILETAIDFSNNDVVITDSGGASATIVNADIATATASVDVNTTITGQYAGIESLLGENLNRIQDSYYYQDFSYEIVVGQSLSTYINELKKAVHPVGFLPFGKVSIATAVSAAVTTTAIGVSAFTGDDTFSPILASVFETLFSQTIQSRLQTAPTTAGLGQRDDQIVLENEIVAGDNLVLNASAADTDEGSNILLETGDGIDLEDGILESILYESGVVKSETTNYAYDGGGRVMAESSYAPSADADRVLVKELVTKISAKPTLRTSRNLLLYLANNPFGGVDSIQLESGIGNESDHLVLDGTLPFQYPDAFFRMEGTSGVDNLILNGTDSSSTNAGGDILLEAGHKIQLENSTYVNISETERLLLENSYEGTGRLKTEASPWSYPSGFIVNENDRIVFENENEFVETIPLSEIGSFRFEDIRRTDKIILDNNSVDQDNANSIENTVVLMENFGQLILDGTDSSSTNAGSFVAQETTKNNKFTLEESGSLIVENNSTHSVVEFLAAESANDEILLEDIHRPLTAFGIQLEQDSYNQDVIILDGMDSDSLYAGLSLELEDIFQVVGIPHIALESTNIIQSEGQIPLDNWTLNSSTNPTGYQPVVHASEIRVRTTGDIALEDSTDTTYGYLVLNGTDGSSTNAGDNLDCEGGTGIAG